MTSYSGPYNPTFLHQQIKALLKFYDPICKDEKLGGFFNQLRDDGTVYDSKTKHAVGKVIDTKQSCDGWGDSSLSIYILASLFLHYDNENNTFIAKKNAIAMVECWAS